jgi:hypothetical protein
MHANRLVKASESSSVIQSTDLLQIFEVEEKSLPDSIGHPP